MTHYILDIYNGAGVEGEAKQDAGTSKRAAIRAAKILAERKWDNVVVVNPADDGVISYGPREGDCYVTVRHPRASSSIDAAVA